METAFYNGIVYTADAAVPVAQAFVVRDGTFVAVGTNSDVAACATKVDLGGRCVIPGLVDSHCHILSGIQQAAMNMIFLENEILPEELGETLSEEVAPGSDGLVAAMGIDITKGTFSARDLDGHFPDRPVMVFSFDGHALLLNTCAMQALGVDREVEDPDENSYFVRGQDGLPTGLVIEIPAMMRCRSLMGDETEGDHGEALEGLLQAYASCGYTTAFDAMSADGEAAEVFPLLKEFDESGKLTMRISGSFCYHGEEYMEPEEALDYMRELRDSVRSDNLRMDTLKMIADGTVEEHSALLSEPYADQPQCRGSELTGAEDMRTMAQLAAEDGFRIHIHAIGDRAVTEVLEVLGGPGRTAPTRTIAHNQIYRAEDIERIAREGDIFFQTTPHWVQFDEATVAFLGEKRAGRQFPFGTMRRNGVAVTFGSDACVGEPSCNAFAGMFYAAARAEDPERFGCFPPAEEGISREEALAAYTIAGARQLGWEKETGSITAGKSADFVILDRDPMTCPIAELPDTTVLETWFRGEQVFRLDADDDGEGKTRR